MVDAANDTQRLAAQKRRNVWLALILVAFVATVGITTIIRLEPDAVSGKCGLYYDGYAEVCTEDTAQPIAQEPDNAE